MVANAGGHLEELWRLRERLPTRDDDVTWVTFDTPQARSLLAGEQRIFVPFAAPRDGRAALANLRLARHVLAFGRWTDIVSTGALVAVPYFLVARGHGVRCHYIESPARVAGPSLTAEILEWLPGVHRYSPYRWWRRRSWSYRGSVLDGFTPGPPVSPTLRRVVVTVGTNRYGFRRLVERVAAALPAGCDVLWQTGHTDVGGLDIDAQPFVTEAALADAMASADLVVAHAGVGSALAAMQAGRAPLLVPRRAGHDEHVDDHQVQIAAELERRGLGVSCDLDDFDADALWRAAAGTVVPAADPAPFVLDRG